MADSYTASEFQTHKTANKMTAPEKKHCKSSLQIKMHTFMYFT